jgi:NADPH-dependent 2,4-dienoyl-CoA reductase/sulfur reductase-like enzyme
MEAAAVAKRRGHTVKLFERQERLGGQLQMAMAPPCKGEIKDLVRHLEIQLRQLDIPIILNCNVTAELIEKENPDVVILATGAKPWVPDIPGVDRENVMTYGDILTQDLPLSGNKMVIAGGGEIGSECADFIRDRQQGCQIIIIEMIDEIAKGMEPVHRRLLLNRLQEKRISIFTKTRLIEINEQGAVVEREGERETFPSDMIVLAMGNTSENGMAEDLRKLNLNCYEIGDCVKPGKMEDAFLSAWKAAFAI